MRQPHLLPFDSHNHVHMGPTPPIRSLFPDGDRQLPPSSTAPVLGGMAIMSTHPRDYTRVLQLSKELPLQVAAAAGEGGGGDENDDSDADRRKLQVVPCFGVHPWFLHELTDRDWEDVVVESAENDDDDVCKSVPRWVAELEDMCVKNPNSIVGEIGLDGFHYDPVTNDLVSTVDKQVLAFEHQFDLAVKIQRPVSIHCVKCTGQLTTTIANIKKKWKEKNKKKMKKGSIIPHPGLPPKVYFHAFGGKAGVVDQLLALCDDKPGGTGSRRRNEAGDDIESDEGSRRGGSVRVYFGFAPVINFRSPKTSDLVRKIGLDRLVLETDHEDAALVPSSIQEGIRFLADALNVEESVVIERTHENALDLYGLRHQLPPSPQN